MGVRLTRKTDIEAELPFLLDTDDNALLRRAEEALAALQDSAVDAFAEDLARAEVAFAAVKENSADAGADLEALYDAIHCIKGLGGALDFNLLTEIGARLCRVLKGLKTVDCDDLVRIEAHLSAMRQVLRDDLRGDGGADGVALLTSLDGNPPVAALQ